MIKEDYVSFEIAKLLKEKGFDEPCECFYDTEHNDISIVNGWMDTSNSLLEEREFLCYSAPTLQMAMKWLREMYDIHVVPRKDFFNGTYTGMIYDGRRENVFDKDDYIALVGYETYEQACEDCIKYCLENLI